MDNSEFDNPDFDAFDFESSEFDNTDFDDTEFGKANVDHADFEKADFGKSDIGKPDVDYTDFEKRDFGKTDFDSTDFGDTDFDSTEIGKAEIGKADIGSANIGNVDIDKAEFETSPIESYGYEPADPDSGLGISEFETIGQDSTDIGNTEFESSRIETYDYESVEPDLGVSEFETTDQISPLELNDTEEFAGDTVAFAKPMDAAREVENEPKVERAKREHSRKKSGSFIRSMDKLVILSAIGLFGTWLLGHGLLYMIGGSSGSSSVAQTASRASGNQEMTVAKLVADVDPSEKEMAEPETSEPDLEAKTEPQTVTPSDDFEEDLAVDDSEDQSWESSAPDTQDNAWEAEPAEMATATPTETVYRPTYSPAESTAETESTGSSTKSNDLNWEHKKPEVQDDQWGDSDQTPGSIGADADMIDNSAEFQAADAEPSLDEFEAESEFEVPSEDIDTESMVEVDDVPLVEEEPPVTEPAVKESENPFVFSKTYPMRVWTSALGNKATLALVEVTEEGGVVVVDEKGTQFTLGLERFSEEDKAYVRDAIRN